MANFADTANMSGSSHTSTYVASEAGFAAMQAERQFRTSTADVSKQYSVMVAGMRAVFDSGRTKDIEWRRRQLQSLIRGIQDNHEAIRAAIDSDLGGPKVRPIFDMAVPINDAEHALAHLDSWTKPWVAHNDLPIDFQSTYQVRPEPKGITLNIGPWNAPFILCFTPLIAATAAGNCMVIKPSEMAPASAEVIEMIVNKYLDTDCVKVVQGAVVETTALLEQRWDHIFYTGNGVVGRIVMKAAAENLTPLTLELGGKSPVFVDKTANMTTVVNRLFNAKFTNQGQICVAPDYVLIDESREKEFLDAFSKQVASSNVGAGSKNNPNWGKIINSRHAERLKRLIDTSGGQVICGGSDDVDVSARHVPLTVLKDVDPNAPIMFEEIFGPILPVLSVKSMDEGIKFVKDRERPLALYIFSQDKAFQERALRECTSGGAAVNTALEQLFNKEAPFGGTGGSGFGRYHGKFGFDEFTHYRTVLYKTGSNPTLPPVEQQPEWLYDVALKGMVTGFVSTQTKQKLKLAGSAVLVAVGGAILRSRL